MISRSGGNWKPEIADDEPGNDGNGGDGKSDVPFLGCGNIRPDGSSAVGNGVILFARIIGVAEVLCRLKDELCVTGMP